MAHASATVSTGRLCERRTASPTWRRRISTRPTPAGSWSPPSSPTNSRSSKKRSAPRPTEQPDSPGSNPPARREEILLMDESGPVTTAGVIAVGNLEARIDGQVSRATAGRLTVGERAELVELIALRGQVLGCIADAERAAAFAGDLVGQVPSDA